ncbi:hypothetical protein Prudu_010261 [Prunus dulcis]|uniref:Uncharacterized protein n=1 Tax=Prunus dulcis TaxID=3755 RepID=A0A4Y1R806_PRUDU|nr:hypothetical protein Prudu_010261 [Prunus dulcis]
MDLKLKEGGFLETQKSQPFGSSQISSNPISYSDSESYPFPIIVLEIMGRPWFLRVFIVSCLLALCFSHGFGRNLLGNIDLEDFSVIVSKETHGQPRKMITVMDYADPEPNVNPRTGKALSG